MTIVILLSSIKKVILFGMNELVLLLVNELIKTMNTHLVSFLLTSVSCITVWNQLFDFQIQSFEMYIGNKL
jgi:hypothetical protein